MSLSLLKILATIGEGMYGKVFQVIDNADGVENTKVYAMKVVSKKGLPEIELNRALNECKVLKSIRHPFIVNLHKTFYTNNTVYMLQDFISGGDLFHHLQTGIFEESRAKLYTMELILAIEYLHSNGIVHRDIKPENVLINSNGHVVLADFGLCKTIGNNTTKTFCGTDLYLAPEIITGCKYNSMVDWWSLGVLLYEMTIGCPSFYSENKDIMYNKILNNKVIFPENLPINLKNIINLLLEKNPIIRTCNIKFIKNHEWFNGMSFEKVYCKEYIPTFIPVVKSKTDTSNFDAIFTNKPPSDVIEYYQSNIVNK